MNDYEILIVGLVICLLEGVHATLVQEIKIAKPDLYNTLGRPGIGYYFLGLFWFAPTYRKFLMNGKLTEELSEYPKLSFLSKELIRHPELIRANKTPI